jgi:pilus assembly protein CpaB
MRKAKSVADSTKKTVRAMFLGIVVAGTACALVWTYLQRFEAEASGGPRVGILATVRTLEPGAILHDEDIGERWIPQSYVETRSIRIADRARIANLRISAPLQAQQTLMWTDIVLASDDRHDPVGKLQSGMRAVTIRAEGKASLLARPADRVDVIGIFSPPGTTDSRTGVVLLQNVLVLGRGESTEAHGNAPDGMDLALSLTLPQAQVLAVAADKGRLSVAVRGRDDVHIQEGLADFPSSALVEAQKLQQATGATHKGPVRMTSAGPSK